MRSTAVACISLTRSLDTASHTLVNGYPLTELEDQWAEGSNESGRLMSLVCGGCGDSLDITEPSPSWRKGLCCRPQCVCA
jgi:hypothetical protein